MLSLTVFFKDACKYSSTLMRVRARTVRYPRCIETERRCSGRESKREEGRDKGKREGTAADKMRERVCKNMGC